jgi:hypothetical protein
MNINYGIVECKVAGIAHIRVAPDVCEFLHVHGATEEDRMIAVEFIAGAVNRRRTKNGFSIDVVRGLAHELGLQESSVFDVKEIEPDVTPEELPDDELG